MNMFNRRSYTVHAVSAPKETVTMIDRELQSIIRKLNSSPRGMPQREELLNQMHALKVRRRNAVQPKTYDRLLAALG